MSRTIRRRSIEAYITLGTVLIDLTHIPDRAAAFYINNFNFTPSDVLTLGPSGPEIGAFLHLDRGKEWVDHRAFSTQAKRPVGDTTHACKIPLAADTLFLQTSADPCSTTATIHHAAFEVFDLDQQVSRSILGLGFASSILRRLSRNRSHSF
jgi:hypothetical protein